MIDLIIKSRKLLYSCSMNLKENNKEEINKLMKNWFGILQWIIFKDKWAWKREKNQKA